MKSKKIIDIIAFSLATLFLYAAIIKFINVRTFQSQLEKSPLIGEYAKQIAWVIPVIEIGVCVLLLRHTSRLTGLFCSFFLIGMFTVYLVAMINTGDNQSCACGELWQGLSTERHIFINLGGILLSGLAIILSGSLKPGVGSLRSEV